MPSALPLAKLIHLKGQVCLVGEEIMEYAERGTRFVPSINDGIAFVLYTLVRSPLQ